MRFFHSLVLVVLVWSCSTGELSLGPSLEDFPYGRYSIIQGVTTDRSTEISIAHALEDQIFSVLRQGPNIIKPKLEWNEAFKGSTDGITKLYFEGLKPGSEYILEIKDERGEILEARELSTFQARKNSLRFAFVSCMSDEYEKKVFKIWDDLLKQKPEVIFFIGDNVYADQFIGGKPHATPEDLWRRYHQTRRHLPIFFQKKLTPVIATWDDHDFGKNDGDASYPHAQASAQIFRQFFAQTMDQKGFDQGPGVSAQFSLFGMNFFFLDNRSFRQGKEHLGKKQMDWFFKGLKKSKGPSFLMAGGQFFGGYHIFESYQRLHPEEFSLFLKGLKNKKSPLVFLSGDRHLSEILKVPRESIGQETFEITSSPIHAKTYSGSDVKFIPPNRLNVVAGPNNYMLVDIKNMKSPLEMEITNYGPGNKLHFQRQLTVPGQ